jgi:GR25 family glycosyltransferase involved in LPS biosynthesis
MNTYEHIEKKQSSGMTKLFHVKSDANDADGGSLHTTLAKTEANVKTAPMSNGTDSNDTHVKTAPMSNGTHSTCLESAQLEFMMINMETRPERLLNQENTLPPWICQRTCRFPAVAGENMTRPSYVTKADWDALKRRVGTPRHIEGSVLFTRGDYGVLESHRRLWERIIKRNATTVIMEDDNVIYDSETLDAGLCDLSLREDWDVVQLRTKDTDYKRARRKRDGPPRLAPNLYRDFGMIAVTPRAARILLDFLTQKSSQGQEPIDCPNGIYRKALDTERLFHIEPPCMRNGGGVGSDTSINGAPFTGHNVSTSSCSIQDCD